jgi:hypothetical protein
MARIPDQEVRRQKNEVAVQRLVEAAWVELKKVGKDLSGKCPLHADDTASLVVTTAMNLWHCFGCQVGGDPIDWVLLPTEFKELTVIKVLNARLTAPFTLEIDFSDHAHGVFDACAYLASRSGRYWTSCTTRRTFSAFSSTRAHCAGPMGSKYHLPDCRNCQHVLRRSD